MSYNTIIAEIIGIDDKNIKFTGKFLKSKVIRGIEHTIIEAELTYNPSRCEHCKTSKDDYNIVKNGNQVTNILVGQFNSKPVILRLKNNVFIANTVVEHLWHKHRWFKKLFYFK